MGTEVLGPIVFIRVRGLIGDHRGLIRVRGTDKVLVRPGSQVRPTSSGSQVIVESWTHWGDLSPRSSW